MLLRKLAQIKHCIKDNAINRNAFKTKHKYLIIESDDWGSIRTPSLNTLNHLIDIGDNPFSEPFIRNDSLESEEDLQQLFDVLSHYTDSNGRKLAMTANFAMANANFEEINRQKIYCREPFYETYEKYYGNNKVLELVKQGESAGIFKPQLHCLEHLRVNQWMQDINAKKKDTIIALQQNMYGIGGSHTADNVYGYMDAFNYSKEGDKIYLSEAIHTACRWFENTFGYKSSTFTASCYVWDDFLESELLKNGISHIQTGPFQILPTYSDEGERYKRIRHFTGEKKDNGLVYTVRNCEYEPSLGYNNEYSISRCMESIANAFHSNTLAIISSHRFNYIGSINSENRVQGLLGLKEIMDWVIKRYPDVEFLTSDEVGQLLLTSEKGK